MNKNDKSKDKRIRTVCDFVTCWFRTLVVSFAHFGGPATFANTQESQLILYKVLSEHLQRDTVQALNA